MDAAEPSFGFQPTININQYKIVNVSIACQLLFLFKAVNYRRVLFFRSTNFVFLIQMNDSIFFIMLKCLISHHILHINFL